MSVLVPVERYIFYVFNFFKSRILIMITSIKTKFSIQVSRQTKGEKPLVWEATAVDQTSLNIKTLRVIGKQMERSINCPREICSVPCHATWANMLRVKSLRFSVVLSGTVRYAWNVIDAYRRMMWLSKYVQYWDTNPASTFCHGEILWQFRLIPAVGRCGRRGHQGCFADGETKRKLND